MHQSTGHLVERGPKVTFTYKMKKANLTSLPRGVYTKLDSKHKTNDTSWWMKAVLHVLPLKMIIPS